MTSQMHNLIGGFIFLLCLDTIVNHSSTLSKVFMHELFLAGFHEVGGYQSLVDKFPYAVAKKQALDLNNKTCGNPPADFMHLARSIVPGESDLPWTGMVFGLTINSIWYWCTDQVSTTKNII